MLAGTYTLLTTSQEASFLAGSVRVGYLWVLLKRTRKPLRKTRLKASNAKRKARRRKAYDAYLRSKAWKALRVQRFAVAKGLCERCEGPITLGTFECHHRTYARFKAELIEDLEALCRPCHRLHHALKDGYKR